MRIYICSLENNNNSDNTNEAFSGKKGRRSKKRSQAYQKCRKNVEAMKYLVDSVITNIGTG
jgi:hypothetical protein